MKSMALYRRPSRKKSETRSSVTKAALPDKEETVEIESLNKQERKDMIKKLEGQMQRSCRLDFELASDSRYDSGNKGDGLRDKYDLFKKLVKKI